MAKSFIMACLILGALSAQASLWEANECKKNQGIYHNGVCLEGVLRSQAALVLGNRFRYKGGNETSIGDHVVELDARVSKDLENGPIRTIFLSVSAVPKDHVLNYNEKDEQNFHNENRLRADGFVDRPAILASVGAKLNVSSNQNLTILAGSFTANGKKPLSGKPSRYYLTAPYGLVVRYDKGIQLNYELKNRLDRILIASFSVIDGDRMSGESDVSPADSRANSYPSLSGSFEIRVAKAINEFFRRATPLLSKHDFYLGVTGTRGDAGSFPGQKRVQDDAIVYLGHQVKTQKGDFEVRVFSSWYSRNPEDDGLGRHVELVHSRGNGVEIAFRGLKSRYCLWDFYGNYHTFENHSEMPDGEFTWDDDNRIEGWTAGTSCRDFAGVENLDIGVEYGELYRHSRSGEFEGGGVYNLTFTYKFGRKGRRNR